MGRLKLNILVHSIGHKKVTHVLCSRENMMKKKIIDPILIAGFFLKRRYQSNNLF